MKLLGSRKFACIILAVCVLGSVIGLGGSHLASQRRAALRAFDEGTNPDFAVRFSMDAYLDSSADLARVMAEEFRRYVDADDENAAQALELAGKIGDGQDLSARRESYESLRAIVETLYTDYSAVSNDSGDAFHRAYDDFQGEADKLKHDDYHVLAERFNAEREGFPAGAVSALWNLAPLDTFR